LLVLLFLRGLVLLRRLVLGVILHLLLSGVLVLFLGFIVFAFFPFSTADETLLSGFGSGVNFDDAFTIKLETVHEG
jgi:hypothetical protein